MPLNPRRQQFVIEYLIDLNATQAAIRAGYAVSGARQQGGRLLTNVDIQRAVAEGQEAAARRANVNADRVLTELARLAFADIADYEGLLRADVVDLQALPPGVSRAISELIVETYVEGRGDDVQAVKRVKVKLHPKQAALDSLAKYLKLYGDRLEVTDPLGEPLGSGAVAALMDRLEGIADRKMLAAPDDAADTG